MPIEGLTTRKPTGAVPYPFILVEGEEKAGKSWTIAELTKSELTGTLYWIDVNEGAADEYGAIPGADYEVVVYDGSYQQLLDAVEKIHAEAKRAQTAGEPPVVIAIDSGTAIWNGLKDWTTARARNTDRNKAILAKDPDAEITVATNFWNDAGARWRRIQTLLMTFPGIAIITARGKEVAVMDDNGRPTKDRTWSVESHRELPFSATVWMRMTRDENPQIIGARSVHAGIKPGVDRAKKITGSAWEGRLLEWLVFDVLKCDPAQAHVRDLKEFHGGELMEHEKVSPEEAAKAAAAEETKQDKPAAAQQRLRRGAERPAERQNGMTAEQWKAEVDKATTRERLNELHAMASQAGQLTQGLLGLMQARAQELVKATPAAAPAEQAAEQPAAPAVDPEEAALAEAEHHGMLVDELAMIAEIMGVTVAKLTERHLPNGSPDGVPAGQLQEVVARIRPIAVQKLKQLKRGAEAAAYAKVGPDEYDIPSNLLTDPASDEQAA